MPMIPRLGSWRYKNKGHSLLYSQFKVNQGPREIVQQLRAVASLLGNPNSLHSTHIAAYNYNSRESNTLFWSPWILGMYKVCR